MQVYIIISSREDVESFCIEATETERKVFSSIAELVNGSASGIFFQIFTDLSEVQDALYDSAVLDPKFPEVPRETLINEVVLNGDSDEVSLDFAKSLVRQVRQAHPAPALFEVHLV